MSLPQKPIKILFILDGRISHWKGTQRFMFELGKFLQKNNFIVYLLENESRVPSDSPVPMNVNIPFKILESRFNVFLGLVNDKMDIVHRIQPDLIYVNSPNTLPFVPSFKIPTIYGLHIINSGYKYYSLGHKLRFKFKFFLFRLIVAFAWRKQKVMFHALNDEQEKLIYNISNKKFPVAVIPNPVDSPENPKEEILNIPKHKKFTITYLGPFSHDKGFDEFLRIIEYINGNENKSIFQFIAIGDGHLMDKILKIQKQYANIKIVRRPEDEEKYKILIDSDLFIYPSKSDSFSLTLAEAQLCGLPALTSDLFPFHNIIINGKTGYMLPLNNLEEAFHEKIMQYLNLWSHDYNGYLSMRIEIADISQRFSKINVLPQFLIMIRDFMGTKVS